MSSLSTLPKGDSAWLLRKAIERIIQQISVLETNIGSSTTGNSANTQIIFNDAGTLRGDAGLTYNKATDTLSTGSATITGDLTVDTSTLKVDSANNRVIVGHTSGSSAFQVTNAGAAGLEIQPTGFSSAPLILSYNRSGSAYTQLTLDGSTIVHALSGTTAMTLNSTGLGVGVTPSAARLEVGGQDGTQFYIRSTGTTPSKIRGFTNAAEAGVIGFLNGGGIYFDISGERMRIDSSGNVGVGVTPSAWNLLTGKTIQLEANASISGGLTHSTYLGQNWFYDGTNSNYIVTGRALLYEQNKSSGNHAWYTAVSGTGGTTATMTQAMTLDASGNLLVGTTSGSFGSRLIISADSGTTSWATGPLPAGPSNYYITANNTQGVFLNGTSATAWTAISDERFKDIIEPITNAVSKVGSLRSVIGKFKTDAEGTRRSFLIAQDVIAVFPEAVVATDPDKLGVTYTEIIPLLVAAIKELTARVQTLEAK